MKQDTVLILISIFLFLALVWTVLYGCHCGDKTEGFVVDGEEDLDLMEDFEVEDEYIPEMTPREKELFQDIKKGALDDKEIMSMIESGKLTEKMVEKFLAQLDAGGGAAAPQTAGSSGAPSLPAPASATAQEATAKRKGKPEEQIEAFENLAEYAKFQV